MRLANYDALTFDVYGTLIEWEPAIVGFFRRWADRNGVRATDGDLLNAFDDARARLQLIRPILPYPEILRASYAKVAERWGVPVDTAEQDDFGRAVGTWPAFADSAAGLAYLKRFYRLGALSNIDNASLPLSLEKLGTGFDVTVTAEDVGAYKPDLRHFAKAISAFGGLGVPVGRILHVAQSLRADVTPGNRLGLATVWVNRGGQLGLTGYGAEEAKPDLTVASIAELVARHRAEVGG